MRWFYLLQVERKDGVRINLAKFTDERIALRQKAKAECLRKQRIYEARRNGTYHGSSYAFFAVSRVPEIMRVSCDGELYDGLLGLK